MMLICTIRVTDGAYFDDERRGVVLARHEYNNRFEKRVYADRDIMVL